MDAPMQQESRLHRSRRDHIVFGVCGGLGDYFAVDPTLIRLAFVLITLAGGAGVLAYIILAIVMPEEGSEPLSGREGLRRNVRQLRTNAGELTSGPSASPEDPFAEGTFDTPYRRRRNGELGAFILITLGLLFLVGNLGWMGWFSWHYFWPVILIVIGAMLLMRRTDHPI
jgi:phage shock protein C